MKLLRASVRNSQKIDKSFEKIFNVLFYFAIACVILNVLGYDPIAVFLSLSSVVLAFSFMISQASSKYIEGLLFILYRRPYDIGVSSTLVEVSWCAICLYSILAFSKIHISLNYQSFRT